MFDIPPVWLAIAAALVWGQATLIPSGFSATPMLRALGTALIAAGCVIIGLAAWEFRRHKTTLVPHLQPKALVDTGVFSWSRNPIYLADAIILFGLCMRWGAYPSVVLVPVFMVFIQKRFIEGEEIRLRSSFGHLFDDYVQKVRRWV